MDKKSQFSIFLANKPGVLTQIFRELAKAKINIESIAMMDSTEHGVLRLVFDNADAARALFKQLNVSFNEADVLAVELPNRPGAVADLCDKLAGAHINIAYLYCTGGAKGGRTLVLLKVPDIKKAIKVLGNSTKSTARDMKIKLRRPATRRG